ncbi:MAG: RsmB/NOP family class I SAM-dependent RNA methyltransferase, partial [Defluviitaleaceae bacterium]|nr:RsmB/NOP family class I SAM-dependent RNA methyltransferase [Defluviitaleaceae bacterium]
MESRITLPLNFLSRMKDMLGSEEFDAFLKSYEDPPVRGIRMNPLKPANSPYNSQVPWCKNGFYYSPDERPAKTIAYHAGLFYIQEPSAMCPVEILGVEAGDKVLDICAAPGGKSVQIAGHLMGRGLLISNDNSASRNRALVKNLERAGVTNAVVLTEQPKNLAKRFPEFFDKILIDVPCSGEGMFRRDPDVIKSYERTPPETYTALQTEILENAAKMLKPSGQMVYSTCTFNTLENENIIANFVQSHNDFSQIQTTRIFPHLSQGEGHFACLLKKIKSFEGGSGETFLQKSFPRELIDFQNTFLCENAFP